MKGAPCHGASASERTRFLIKSNEDPLAGDGPNVIANFSKSPKKISSVYVYDRIGTLLFEKQCNTPEYYLRRAEMQLLQIHAKEIIELCNFPDIVELGAGTAAKTRLLLAQYSNRGVHYDYYPIDIDAETLAEAARVLTSVFSGLFVHCLGASYREGLCALPASTAPRLFLFLGSSLGNMELREMEELLWQLFSRSRQGDYLLIGADLDKESETINSAYNDRAGYGSRSTLNMLSHLNWRYGGDFVLERFGYRSQYDSRLKRNEVRIESLAEQDVTLSRLGLRVPFDRSELIDAEVMWKFDPEELSALFGSSGLLHDLSMDRKHLPLWPVSIGPEVICLRNGLGLAVPMICTSAIGVATGMMWPLLSLRLDLMGFDSGSIGLSASVQSAAALVVSPLVPELLIRCGTIRLVGASLFGIIICLLAFPAFPSFDCWLGIRAAFGAAVSMVSIAAPIWITGLIPGNNKGTTIGMFGLLWSAGFALGPSIIWSTRSVGWLPFVASAGIVTVAALPLWMLQGDAPVVIAATAKHWSSVLRSSTTPALTAALMLGIMDAANDSFLPLYGLRNGLDERSAVSMLVTLQIGVTAAQMPVGWLADRMRNARLMLVLAASGTLALSFLALTAQYPCWRLADLGMLGFSIGGIWTTSVVLLAEQFNECERAVGNMARAFLYGLGGILFPPLLGFGIDELGADVLPVSGAAAFLLLGLSCARAQSSRRKERI